MMMPGAYGTEAPALADTALPMTGPVWTIILANKSRRDTRKDSPRLIHAESTVASSLIAILLAYLLASRQQQLAWNIRFPM